MKKDAGTEGLESKPKAKPEDKGGDKKAGEKKKPAAKKGGKKLLSIHTTKADDGSFIHEHQYEGDPRLHSYTSSDMDDLHDHMDQHLGGAGSPAGAGDEEGAGGGDPGAAAGGAGAPAAAAAAPEDGEE